MAKITRQPQKIFGSSAGTNQITQFGSFAAGSIAYTTNITTIQALSNYLTGWFGAVLGSENPCIEDWNALCYLFAYQLAYILQTGIAEWETTTPYYIGCFASDSTGGIYYSLTDNNTGNALSDSTKWKSLLFSSPAKAENYSLTTSVAASAMTITLKDAAGNTPSLGSPCIFSMRSSTAATGTYVVRTVTSATSLVIPSGATLGTYDGLDRFLYVYILDNAGTEELAVSSQLFDCGSLQSSSAISGGSSSLVLYSTTARSNVAIRLIGRLKVNEATAGTWATNASEVALNFNQDIASAEQNIGTLTWIGSADPSGTIVKKYFWTQTGKTVTFQARITASSQGTSNTQVQFPLPSDVPSPRVFSTVGSNEAPGICGSGNIGAGVASTPAVGCCRVSYPAPSNNGVFQVNIISASVNAGYAECCVVYQTS